jgi:hypothetical protein
MPHAKIRASRFASRLAASAIAAAIGFVAISAFGVAPAAAAYWGPFKKVCVGDAVAKYSAILQGIPPGQSWERACARSGATINGRRYANPSRCVNTRAAMWGEFVVQDESCRRPRAQLRWGTFKDNGCVIFDKKGWGMRSYSSVLWGIPPGQSWEATCARAPANVAGRHFSHPTACVKADLKDAAQVVKTVAKLVARAAKHSKHPKIYLAAKGTALVATIMKAANPALNIWGVFYVEDRRCPDFG